MSVKQLTEQLSEFLSLKGGCTGSSESTLVKMPHCWKSHVAAHFLYNRIRDTNVKCKGDGTTSLWRRYSEFELLRNYLEIMYPAVVVPPLPEKKVRSGSQKHTG